MADIQCYRHPEVAAGDTCSMCLQAICAVCLTYADMRPACAPCARKHRQGSRVKTMVLVGLVVLLVGGAVLGYLLTHETPYDYGKHAGAVAALEGQLEMEPCDRVKIVKLGDTMMQAGNYRGALARSEAFFEQCGEHNRLLWVTYGAHKRLGENDAAIEVATRLIESDPGDKDYWWWRGIIYERSGRLEEAIADYEKAIDVEPRLSSIPFNLSTLYERLERPCDAMPPIERYLEHHPKHRNDPAVEQRLARLALACANPASETDGDGIAASAPVPEEPEPKRSGRRPRSR